MEDAGHDICRTGQELFAAMNNQSGITLVEIAISVAIIGILMGGALELQQRARAQRQFESTYNNMDTIIQALSIYVETAGRLPCPADPAVSDASFGWERGVKTADLQGKHSPNGRWDGKKRDGTAGVISTAMRSVLCSHVRTTRPWLPPTPARCTDVAATRDGLVRSTAITA